MNNDGDLVSMFLVMDVICVECRKAMKYQKHKFKLDDLSVESFCVYDDIVKDMLIQYKELWDEALYPVFFYSIKRHIEKKYHNYSLVMIPSSSKKVEQRGFDHLSRMLEVVNLNRYEVFRKNFHEQKHLSFEERMKNRDTMLTQISEIPNTPILLVDDMCTTGSSLLAAYQVLKSHKYPVKALTFCYHKELKNVGMLDNLKNIIHRRGGK